MIVAMLAVAFTASAASAQRLGSKAVSDELFALESRIVDCELKAPIDMMMAAQQRTLLNRSIVDRFKARRVYLRLFRIPLESSCHTAYPLRASSSRREAGPRLTSLVSRRFLPHAARLAAHAQGMYPRPQEAGQRYALSAPASCECTALHRDAATSQLWKSPGQNDLSYRTVTLPKSANS